MRALEVLKWMRDKKSVPNTREGSKIGKPSNSELARWIKSGSVVFDGEVLRFEEEIWWAPCEVVFFPSSRHRVTTGGFECVEFER